MFDEPVIQSWLSERVRSAPIVTSERGPTGVATQDKWLSHGLDPTLKSLRVANYVKTLRRDLLKVSETCGVEHPALIGPESVEVLDTLTDGRFLDEVYGYHPGWGQVSEEQRKAVTSIMTGAPEGDSRPESGAAQG